MTSNRFLNDARVPLLGSPSIQEDKKRKPSQDTKAVIIAINDKEKSQRLAKTLDLTKTKSKRKKCAEFILRYDIRIGLVLTMAIGGTASYMIWKYYWSPQQDLIAELFNQRSLIHSQYNASHCPGKGYWYHPEIQVDCMEGKRIVPEFNYLINQDDYCLIGSCQSEFAKKLIDNLPALCIPFMDQLCEVLKKIDKENGATIGMAIALVIVSILLAAGVTGFSYKACRKAGLLTIEEEAEAKEVLQDYGLEVENPQLLLPALERTYISEQIFNDSQKSRYLPDPILRIILKYADLSPGYFIELQNFFQQSCIWEEVGEGERVKALTSKESKEDKARQSNNPFQALFAKIPKDGPTYYQLKSGAKVVHERKNLDADSVAARIFQFARI